MRQTAMRDRLCREEFATGLAQTAADGIAGGTLEVYLAILVHLNLPSGDGISLIQQLRAQPRYGDTLIVVVSAKSGPGCDDFEFSSLVVLDWLIKPLDIPDLSCTDRPGGSMRMRVLHLDDDANVRSIVGQALHVSA
jgi:DNA-binding response OmpR family regulator